MNKSKNTYSGIFRDGGAGRLAKKRYRARRKRLLNKENILMAITGVPYGPGQETVWAYAHCPTYQEPAIMYLTGINQSNVILLLDPYSFESDEILFVSKKDLSKEFWDGIRFGVGDTKSVREVRWVTGIKDIRDIDDFDEVLKGRFKKQRKKKLGTLWMEGTLEKKIVEIKKPSNVYNADYKLIDDTIEEIKKCCRKVCTSDYAANNVYVILQLALKKVTQAEA